MLDDIKQNGQNRAIPKPELHDPVVVAPHFDAQLPNYDTITDSPKSSAESGSPSAPEQPVIKHKNPNKIKLWWCNSTKKKRVLYIALTLLVIITAGVCSKILLKKTVPADTKVLKNASIKPVPKPPSTVASNLTGLQVDPSVNQKAVLGVMIENSPDARPQSGLKDAGIVFEAIAEGGITRFLTLFQDTISARIGPVRSVRPYYLDWAVPFNASIAHAGGSGEALLQIRSDNIRDLDEFANSKAYHRITERYAPHNLYTDTTKLYELMNSKNYNKADFVPIARAPKDTPPTTITAKTVDMVLSGPLYNVHYDYDQPSNSYKRSQAGQPHLDEASNKQLAPKIVVALVVPYSIATDDIHSIYNTSGTGTAYIFENGSVLEVIWHKTNRASQYTFTDKAGAVVPLNSGQTWFTAVTAATKVSYTP